MIYIIYCLDHDIKPSAVVGAINLVVSVGLLSLITDKWIRKMK